MRIFRTTTDSSKSKSKAVRFLNDTECVQVPALEKDLLPVINHLKSIEGRLDKMVAKPGKNQSKSPSSSAASTPPATPPPLMPPQQQSCCPRNPTSNQQFDNQGQRQPRPPAFQPRTFTPQTGRFPAPQFSNPPRFSGPWRPQGSPRFSSAPRAAGTPRFVGSGACYVCGQLGCHSKFHASSGSAPRPVSPRLEFDNDNRPRVCYVCGVFGCHSRNHPDQRPNQLPRPSFAPPNPQFSGNGPRSPTSGNRAPSPQFRPQSQ